MAIEIGLGRAVLNSSPVDFTSTKLSAAPSAVFAQMNRYVGSAATESAHATWAMGATDGTSQFAGIIWSDDAQSSTRVRRYFDSNYTLIGFPEDPSDAVSTDALAHNSFLTDGWRADYTDQSSGDPEPVACMFGGSDVTAEAGVVTLNGTSAIIESFSNTTLTPNVILFWSTNNSDGNESTFYNGSFGIGINQDDGTIVQRVFSVNEPNNASAGDPGAEIGTGYISKQMNDAGTTFDWQTSLDSISEGSFTVSADSDPGGDALGYLALQIDNANIALVDIDLPTATGINEQTGPGFQPLFVMQCLSMLTALDTLERNAKGGANAISMFNDTEEVCHAWAIESGAATTDTQTQVGDKAVLYDAHDGTAAFDGAFNAFTSNGWEINYSTVDGTARKGFALAIGEATSGTTDSAVITSATATPLSSTDTTTATDNATITAAVASVIASTDTSSATDSAQVTSVTAAVLTGTAQAIASDAAAIVTASATPLTSTEATDSANNVADNAVITTASAVTLTATEASQSSDQASITAASITIQTSAETATALDNALIVNAQGSPIASIESVQTDANITTLTVTPLTSTETTGTAQILLGTPVVTPALSGEPNVVPVLSASPEVVAQLRASLSIKPE